MCRGRGWNAAGCRARTRDRRLRGACTAGARSKGLAHAAVLRCSSSRRCSRRATRRRTRLSRRRRHCDGRYCPCVPSMVLTLGVFPWPCPPGVFPPWPGAVLGAPHPHPGCGICSRRTKCLQGMNLKIPWHHLQRRPCGAGGGQWPSLQLWEVLAGALVRKLPHGSFCTPVLVLN